MFQLSYVNIISELSKRFSLEKLPFKSSWNIENSE